jgi:predicted dehydrogenase
MHPRELEGKDKMFAMVAGCDVIKERRDRFAEKFRCPVYRDYAAMLKDPNIELVSIATRSPDHVPHALAALKAGKYVFLEKPIAASYTEAKKLKPAAAKARGKLFIRHNRRFEPGFLHVREIIASGILGDVYQIKLARLGFSRRDDWQTLKKCGGGQLLNWGPHIIDHALQFLASPVASIWSDLKCVAAVGDAEDHVKILLRGKNGRTVDLEISGGAASRLPEYVVWGTKGALVLQGNTIQLRYLNPKKKLKPRRAKAGNPGQTFGTPEKLPWVEKTLKVNPKKSYNIWDELYKAIREKKRFPITLDEALNVMKVVSEARKGTKF